MRVLISKNEDKLATALGKFAKTATVKAMFGNRVIGGNVVTLGDPEEDGTAPCLSDNIFEPIDAIGINRFDLDILGGILSIQGKKPDSPKEMSFWDLVAYVTQNGSHHIPESEASEKDICRLYAFYAYIRRNKITAPDDGSVKDITTSISAINDALDRIFKNDKGLLFEGRAYRKDEENLNKTSFLEAADDVIVRVSSRFTNHLYRTPNGKVSKCVVAYNTSHGKITVSFASRQDISAAKLVQNIWGDDAGGPLNNRTIAGSPHGARMDLEQLHRAVKAVREELA